MRISLEVFGIPEEACEPVRRAVYDSYERFLRRNGNRESATSLGVQGGTCPLTGRGYLSVRVLSPLSVEMEALQNFSDSVYAAHPLREDEVVRANRSLRVEDSPAEDGAPADPLDEKDLMDDEISCWICGRFNGEEYYDHETDGTAALRVTVEQRGRVPLCAVCQRLLQHRGIIE